MKWLAVSVAGLAALAGTAKAQHPSPPPNQIDFLTPQLRMTQNALAENKGELAQLKETIRSLQQQIAQLEQRVKQLEGETALRYRFLPNPARPQPQTPFFQLPPDKKLIPLPNGGYFRPLMPRPSSER